MIRSIGAVITGYAVMAILVMLGFGLIKQFVPDAFPTPEAFPSTGMSLTIIGFGLIAALAGGYVAAWIAGKKKLRHGVFLGAVVLVMGIISVIVSPVTQPLWYNISIILSGVIGVILGAILRKEAVQE